MLKRCLSWVFSCSAAMQRQPSSWMTMKIPGMRAVHALLLFAATFVSYLTRNNINMAVLKMTEGAEAVCRGNTGRDLM